MALQGLCAVLLGDKGNKKALVDCTRAFKADRPRMVMADRAER
jgi:hypothetical protein